MSFRNKVAIVTGAASGIGAAAAHRYAEEGAAVCVADRNGPAAERVADTIVKSGGQAFACEVDISTVEGNDRMFDETVARFGRVDAAFLNAGFMGGQISFEEQSLEFFQQIVQVNLVGCFLGLKSAHRVLRPGGAVAVTASIAGIGGMQSNPGYGAAKHGVVGLVKAASYAFSLKSLRVNAILPGRVRTAMNVEDFTTPMLTDTIDPDDLPVVPYRGEALPQHIAELALFLTSPRANFINGAAYAADAAFSAILAGPALLSSNPR